MNSHRSKKPPLRLSNQRGITLLEVVVSTAIFTIGVLGLTRLQVMAAQGDGQARRMDNATAAATDLLSYLQSVPFEQADFLVPVGNDYADFLDENPFSTVFRGTGVPESTEFDFDSSALPDLAVDAGATVPCMGTICAPFPGVTDGAVDLTRPTLDPRYERYWRLQWMDVVRPNGTGRTLGVAVIVRWREPGTRGHRRVVVFGTRYHPQDILP